VTAATRTLTPEPEPGPGHPRIDFEMKGGPTQREPGVERSEVTDGGARFGGETIGRHPGRQGGKHQDRPSYPLRAEGAGFLRGGDPESPGIKPLERADYR